MSRSLSCIPSRRRCLQWAGGALAGIAVWPSVAADDLVVAGARLSADFDPVAAIWLGYDPGHEAFTADLAQTLAPHVPLKMLVRDAEAQARAMAVLRSRGVNALRVAFVQDGRAPFFVRDGAVFGLDGRARPFIVDFQWTHYGWTNWCRRTFAGSRARALDCARTDDIETGALDQRLAGVLGLACLASPLAIEGGGVEVNGRGTIIANASLWRERNRGLSRDAIEKHLLALPGMRKVVWVPHGLAHDPLHRATIVGHYVGWGTGGHTDEFVRFADENTVLLAWVDEEDARGHPVARLNQLRMQANLEALSNSTDQRGRPLRVIKVPLPSMVERAVVLSADADTAYSNEWTATSFPARERRREGDTVMQLATTSYLNHVLANDLVVLPTYVAHGTPPEREEQVRNIYASVFPGRRVVFIDAMLANWVGGGAHCATLTEPAPG
ncbi:agmatine deiminase family protein [Comamonadaceae bacterium G21597-S1]|nr:agmatine deiminase family protein [Comamonadaceae bacterium G21597-S1]